MVSFDLNIDSNADEVADLMAEVGEKIVQAAQISATNKALAKATTAIRKEMSAETGVPSKELGRRIKLFKANRKKKFAKLFVGTLPIKVILLNAKALAKNKGISFKGPGGRARNPHAFFATMKSGHRGVFKRRGEKRLPIDEVTVDILPAARIAVNKQVNGPLLASFKKIFNSEFNFRTGQAIERKRLKR